MFTNFTIFLEGRKQKKTIFFAKNLKFESKEDRKELPETLNICHLRNLSLKTTLKFPSYTNKVNSLNKSNLPWSSIWDSLDIPSEQRHAEEPFRLPPWLEGRLRIVWQDAVAPPGVPPELPDRRGWHCCHPAQHWHWK